MFNTEALNSDEPVFCFEGFFDAMSAEVAGFKAVALGGRGEGDLLLAAIDQLKHKPQIIILFDPDKAGRESAPELRDALLQIKCPCVVLGSAITLLKSCDSILIIADDLNRHNELFCVPNGVVNLQTGELYHLDPKYLITQQSPAIYRHGYRSPTVNNFLTSILPDEATRAALVRFIGYSATGEVIEEKALFLYGPGGNKLSPCYHRRITAGRQT